MASRVAASLGRRLFCSAHKQRNKTINSTRARVEHVFAARSQQGGKCVRAMTLARNALTIALQCAAYNARRLV